jgi:predicted transcriptional regulator
MKELTELDIAILEYLDKNKKANVKELSEKCFYSITATQLSVLKLYSIGKLFRLQDGRLYIYFHSNDYHEFKKAEKELKTKLKTNEAELKRRGYKKGTIQMIQTHVRRFLIDEMIREFDKKVKELA